MAHLSRGVVCVAVAVSSYLLAVHEHFLLSESNDVDEIDDFVQHRHDVFLRGVEQVQLEVVKVCWEVVVAHVSGAVDDVRDALLAQLGLRGRHFLSAHEQVVGDRSAVPAEVVNLGLLAVERREVGAIIGHAGLAHRDHRSERGGGGGGGGGSRRGGSCI